MLRAAVLPAPMANHRGGPVTVAPAHTPSLVVGRRRPQGSSWSVSSPGVVAAIMGWGGAQRHDHHVHLRINRCPDFQLARGGRFVRLPRPMRTQVMPDTHTFSSARWRWGWSAAQNGCPPPWRGALSTRRAAPSTPAVYDGDFRALAQRGAGRVHTTLPPPTTATRALVYRACPRRAGLHASGLRGSGIRWRKARRWRFPRYHKLGQACAAADEYRVEALALHQLVDGHGAAHHRVRLTSTPRRFTLRSLGPQRFPWANGNRGCRRPARRPLVQGFKIFTS